jgi:DNA polymerase III subunit delta
MSIFFYYGEDDYALQKAVQTLRDQYLDPNWSSFNYDKIFPEQSDAVIQGLNQGMTPPFGFGSRLVWLVNTTLAQHCSEQLLTELERTLPKIPESVVLLFTSPSKPDGRLKSTKLLQKYAQFQEFSLIPLWKTDELVQRVQKVAQELQIKITPKAVEALALAVGSDTRLLYNELQKLQIYAETQTGVIDLAEVDALVTCSSQSSLQLAAAIRGGKTIEALQLVEELLSRNEHPLRIVATLIGQFRTWLWVKMLSEAGEKDDKIAQWADLGNPKRVYFLKQEIRSLRLDALTATLPLLLELEFSLKRGADPRDTLQTKMVQICDLFR